MIPIGKRYNTPHRSHVVKTRMTKEEYADFTERLKNYDMSQAEFIRQAITGATIFAFLGILLFPARAACQKRAAFATYRRIGGLIAIIPKDWKYLRGDIYYADMEPHIGSEQGGTRPVVVLQNDVGNRYAPTLIVATVTSRTEKKRYQPTHVLIAHNTAFEKPSVVQLEQIFTIDKSRIQRFLGQTTRHEMRRIEEALMNSLEINEWDRRNADE